MISLPVGVVSFKRSSVDAADEEASHGCECRQLFSRNGVEDHLPVMTPLQAVTTAQQAIPTATTIMTTARAFSGYSESGGFRSEI
jgi:hypothetical protein